MSQDNLTEQRVKAPLTIQRFRLDILSIIGNDKFAQNVLVVSLLDKLHVAIAEECVEGAFE